MNTTISNTAKRLIPTAHRKHLFTILSAATRLTVRDPDLKTFADARGARVNRIMSGRLRGRVFITPVGQRSPAYTLGTFEQHLAGRMADLVAAGATVYDVGANVGWHTLLLADLVGPSGHVVAFEPSPGDREILHRNLATNGAANVTVEPAAVGATSGTVNFATFNFPGVHHIVRGDTPDDGQIIPAPCVPLDEYVYDDGRPAPSFVKVDVEGGEVDVLVGAERLLAAGRPVVAVEVRRDAAAWVARLAGRLDYAVEELRGDGFIADVLLLPR